MKPLKRMTMSLATLAALVGAVPPAAAFLENGRLTPPERRGKQIYLRGTTSEGKEITAYLGNPPTDVPGGLMACANCHGHDGRGNPEGGVTPSDVTWQVLTKPYGLAHEGGRQHPPYTEALLDRAIAAGLDPAGNRLSPAMPRYGLSSQDMSDLIAYMKRVGTDRDPGLTEDTLTLGTLVPASGPLAETGEAIRAVLLAYFADLNDQGGIYSRKIELRVAHCGETVAATTKAVEQFVEEQQVFAMVGAFIAGAEKEVAAMLALKEVPLVGPATLHPQIAYPLNRQVFYLFSGITEESRALVSFAAQSSGSRSEPLALVYPEDAASTEIAAAAEAQCRKSGWADAVKVQYARGQFDASAVAQRLSHNGTGSLLFLGSGADAAALAEQAAKLGWKPRLFLPGAVAGRELLEIRSSFQGQVFLSFPMRSSDQSAEGAKQFSDFAARHKLPARHLAAMLSAYSAAKLLVQGLKLAGRDVSREKLIGALEGMYKFDTGVTPPLTYGPNRRIGALGAYVVEVRLANKALAPASEWIDVQ